MLSDEEKKAFESVKDMFSDVTIEDIDEQSITIYGVAMLDVIKVLTIVEKQSKEIEELKREKETNQQMIHLAETQILGYGQGYKDGLNKETTATEIVARERENQIIYEGIKHKINMQWVLKIKAKIEELEKLNFGTDLVSQFTANLTTITILQSLLEKE